MNFESFKLSLGEWGEKLKPFIESKACDEIYAYLKQRSKEGKVICPDSEETFRAFEKTPLSKLKVIFFLQDPYPWIKKNSEGKQVKVADGIAMSCSHTPGLQPSLELFYNAIVDCLPEYKKLLKDGDAMYDNNLEYLCEQGIMMLNTSLTVEANKSNSHSEIMKDGKKIRLWEPFIKFLLEDVISRYEKRLVLVFCGNESKYYKKYINPLQHVCIDVEHPAAASHKQREWEHDGIFLTINRVVKEEWKNDILWLNADLPF